MNEASEAELLDLPVRPDPYVGKVLAGRYRVVRVIGTGGMGAVYEAEHTLIGRRVAVKMLHAQLAGDATVVKRFVNEARAAAMIGHPNILDCTDIGQSEDGSPFLVLELLQGRDLDGDITANGPLSVGRMARIAMSAASALGAAHEKGIIHRDMKPENVYLCSDRDKPDHVKVLDFGISKFGTMKATGPGTLAGSAMGTPYYMAPEQFKDASSVDARADIYAMGIILYQGLTGRLPFIADNLPGLALEITTGTPPAITSIRTDVPVELEAVVMKAMARNVADRYQTMGELQKALAPFASLDLPVEVVEGAASATGTADTQLKISSAAKSRVRLREDEAQETKSKAPMIAAAAVLLVGVGVGGYFATRPAPEPAQPVAPVAAAPAPEPTREVEPPPAAPAAPVVAPPTRHTLSIASPNEGATALVRGRHVALPFTESLEPGSGLEIIEVAAPRHTTLRYSIVLDAPKSFVVDLPRGSGTRMASADDLARALSGGGSSSAPSRAQAHGAPAAPAAATPVPAPTSAPTPAPERERPQRNPGVYVGPSGDVPSL